MKNRLSIYTLLTAAVSLLAAISCSESDMPTDNTRLPDGQYPLRIGSVSLSVEGGETHPWGVSQTRVGETADGLGSTFKPDDVFGVELNGATSSFIVGADGRISCNGQALYWGSTQTATVNAWYPADAATLNLSDQESNGLAYLLRGTGKGAYDTPVALTFTHALAKVRITPSAEALNEVQTLELYTYTQCTHDKGINVFGANAGWVKMKPCTYGSTTCWEANVVPGREITALRANGTEVRTISSVIRPVAGKFYNITLNKTPDYVWDDLTNTYTVYTEEGLKIWAAAARQDLATNCILARDIQMTAVGEKESNWTPIGSLAGPYVGTFDGDGYSITGLTFSTAIQHTGFFGNVGVGGTVRNLTLNDVKIDAEWAANHLYVGGVVGSNHGEVIGCDVSGTITAVNTGTYTYAGGIVGGNSADGTGIGMVSGCVSTVAVSASGKRATSGGVAGYNSGIISDCSYESNVVSATSPDFYAYCGGVVGNLSSGNDSAVNACYAVDATVSVSCSGQGRAGGVVGSSSGTIEGCYFSAGSITTSSGSFIYIGGVVGEASSSKVNGCYAAPKSIDNPGGKVYVGGVVGNNSVNASVTASFWSGDLSVGVGKETGTSSVWKVPDDRSWAEATAAMNGALPVGFGWMYIQNAGEDNPPVLY